MTRFVAPLLVALLLTPVARAQDGFTLSAWVEMEPAVEARALEAAGRALDEVDLFNFAIDARGGFAESALAGHRTFIEAAHARGATVSITFIDWVGSARLVVANSALSARFAATLARAAERHGLDAVCLDFEQLPRALRGALSRFVRQVAAALHARGKRLTVAVGAKTTDAGNGTTQAALDYAALGAAADALQLMTYDYSGAWSGPGPIGPAHWCRKVVAYARACGVPASKLRLGVPLYGRSWPGARNVGPGAAARAAREAGVTPVLDAAAGEARFTVAGRTTWFTNGASVAAKVSLARELGLGGVCCYSMKWAGDEQLAALARARSGLIAHVPR